MEWRVCAGYPDFEISEYGHLRRLRGVRGHGAGHLKKAQRHTGGYLYYSMTGPGPEWERKHEYVHRLVLLTFIGPPPSLHHQTAHNDGTKTNNHYSNLRWALPVENQADRRWLHNTRLYGDIAPNARLTTQQVLLARWKYRTSEITQHELGREFGVSRTHMGNIIRRERWRWL